MNLQVLDGPNFSGRTSRLREWVGLPNNPSVDANYNQNVYIGPDAADSFSGIAPTISSELELMAIDKTAAKSARGALESLGYGYCLDRNPYTLSGGEQVVAAVIAATAARPKRMAIDSALEQLSPSTRFALLRYLDDLDGDLMVADNRLDEWFKSGDREILEAQPGAPMMRADSAPSISRRSDTVELVDLCHAYIKGRLVFDNLNLRLDAGTQYLLKGPNGCGKSTLSKILCGLVKPSSGEIRVNGRVVKPWLTPGRSVGYHFQNPDYQLFSSTVRNQIGAKSVQGVARYFGFEDMLDMHPLDLPFVMRKRVTVAATLLRETGSTILDEPTIGQDASYVACLLTTLRNFMCITISHSSAFNSFESIVMSRNGAAA